MPSRSPRITPILPLARRRDKITQIKWGIASFIHRFGRQPRGMWLPEMAVDLVTLEILSRRGLSFTILSEEQVQGEVHGDAGPYRVRLPGGGFFAVFVRDRQSVQSTLVCHRSDRRLAVTGWPIRCAGGRA